MNERTVTVASGDTFQVRHMEPADATTVLEGFEHLSAESARRRFFSASFHDLGVHRVAELVTPGPGQLVLLAFDERGHLAGGARAVQDISDPSAAEIALTIGDHWQLHGLGGELIRLLARDARDLGVDRLYGFIQVDNGPARTLLEKSSAVWWIDEPGVIGFEVLLTREAIPSSRALDAAFRTAS